MDDPGTGGTYQQSANGGSTERPYFFQDQLISQDLILILDNVSVAFYINKQGGTLSESRWESRQDLLAGDT